MAKLAVAIAALLLVSAGFAQDRAPAKERIAGKVVLVEGDARFRGRSGTERRVKPGDALYEGDSVVTGADGEVHLAMGDGGYIGARPNTEMSFDVFVADGRPDDRSEISLIKGSFRTVTGWIGKAQSALIRTFDATIGIRGTDHEPLVVPPGSGEGEPGTYDRVYIGATLLGAPRGAVELRAGQAGYAPRGAGIPPRVLAVIPSFFRPARNEARFNGLHDRIQEQLEKLRRERGLSADARDDRAAGRAERADRPDKPEKPEKPDKPQRPDRPDRPPKPGK
jgi:hypothetical protein